MPTVRDVYNEMKALHSNAVEDITLRLLLAEVNDFETMSDLYVGMNKQMKGLNEFQRLFARVLSGEPVQYVLKKTTFMEIALYIDERVLIPRPETEELVEKLTTFIHDNYSKKNLVIADIGTGSGCIVFALEKRFPKSVIIATDISGPALDVAKINAARLKSHVIFYQGDMLLPIIAKQIKLDILVSNPPYIENIKEADLNVVSYEPHIALFALHGIDYYEKMIKIFPLVLNEGALIFFEINYDQEERLAKLVADNIPESKVNFIKDLQGKTRFMSIVYSLNNDKIK